MIILTTCNSSVDEMGHRDHLRHVTSKAVAASFTDGDAAQPRNIQIIKVYGI